MWQAPQEVPAGSSAETLDLWLNTHSRSSWVVGRWPMSTPDSVDPICGNVWHVAQADGIDSFVSAPSPTL